MKDDTIIESDLQNEYFHPIYLRYSRNVSDKVFVNIDNGQMGGTHWSGFFISDNNSFCFDSFGRQPDELLLDHFSKPIFYHNNKIQVIKRNLCGTKCVYFFNLIDRKIYYDAILKKCFR